MTKNDLKEAIKHTTKAREALAKVGRIDWIYSALTSHIAEMEVELLAIGAGARARLAHKLNK